MARRFLRWLWLAKPPSSNFPVPVCQFVIALCGMFGVAYLIAGSVHWRWEHNYEAEGVQTDTGVVLAKWQETSEGSEGGTITETFLRYQYADQKGRFHEHLKTSRHERWDDLSTGSRLPPIEYLASDPRMHRDAREKGVGRKFFWVGLGLLAAIIPFRLAYGAATQCVRISRGEKISRLCSGKEP